MSKKSMKNYVTTDIEKCELRYRIISNMKGKLILIHAKRDRYKHIRQRLK